MSEILGTGFVTILPDTKRFRELLLAEVQGAVAAAAETAVVPVRLAVTEAGVAGLANQAETLAVSQRNAQISTTELAASNGALINSERNAAIGAVRQATAARQVTAAQTAGAAAVAKLAAAQATVVGASSEVAAAEIRQTRAVAAAAAGERALQKALAAKNIGLIDSASNTLRLASAEEEEALAALSAARAQAGHAATLGAAGRAAAAFGAGAAGLRGSVIGAQLPFIATIAGLAAIAKSVQAASDLNEEINKSDVIFKESAAAIVDWSRSTASSLGISQVAALKAAGAFGNILVPLGVVPRQAAIMSQTFVKLAADMASFNNASPERTLAALQSGLVGQSRPLRVFGVQLTAARVEEEALRETGKTHTKELTQQDKVLARYTLTLQDAALQIGDVARTQSRLANQSRFLRAELADTGASAGHILVPALTAVVHGLNENINAFQRAGHFAADFAKKFADALKQQPGVGGTLGTIEKIRQGGHDLIEAGFSAVGWSEKAKVALGSTGQLAAAIGDLGEKARKTGGPAGIVELSSKLQDLITGFNEGGPKGREFAAALARVLADVQRTGQQGLKIPLNVQFELALADLRVQQSNILGEIGSSFNTFAASNPIPVKVSLDLQFDLAQALKASSQTQLSIARQQREQALNTIRRILGVPEGTREEILAAAKTAKVAASQKKAFDDAVSRASTAQSEIESIIGKQTSDAKSRATKRAEEARKAAAAVKKARQAADQALLDSISSQEQGLLDQQTAAQTTASQRDDERVTRRLIAFYNAKIEQVKQRIHDANSARDQIRALNEKLFQAERDLIAEGAQARALAIQAGEQRLANQAQLASETTTLRDDAAVARRKVAFYRHRIDIVRKTVKDAEEAATELKDLRQKLFDAEAAQREATRNLRQQQRANAQERADLAVQIAADSGNRAKEIAARRAQIALTERLIRQQRQGSLARLRLIAQLRQEQKELRDLAAAQKEATKASAEAQFEFLRTQSGFAANLLGNLIPLGATGNLVGGTTAGGTSGALPKIPSDVGQTDQNIQRRGVQDILAGRSAAAEGRNIGPTRVGQRTEIHHLSEIHRLLREIHRGNGHPEATHRRTVNRRGLSEFGYSGSHNI